MTTTIRRERGDWMVFLCLEEKGDEKQRATRRERKSTETYQARKRDCRWMACKDENMIKLQDSQDCDYWWGCPSIQYIQYVFACGPTQLRTNACDSFTFKRIDTVITTMLLPCTQKLALRPAMRNSQMTLEV